MSASQSSLRKSAQVIQQVLAQKGLDFQVVELETSTRTAHEAAAAIGCSVAQIVKSLIFKTEKTHKPVLILVSGANRVNEKAIASYLGEAITKADANFTRDVTGFAIGGIPPVGHKQKIDLILIDEDLLKFETIWAAAGTPNAVFRLASKELPALTHGRMISMHTALSEKG